MGRLLYQIGETFYLFSTTLSPPAILVSGTRKEVFNFLLAEKHVQLTAWMDSELKRSDLYYDDYFMQLEELIKNG